jgi:hypothetical protein
LAAAAQAEPSLERTLREAQQVGHLPLEFAWPVLARLEVHFHDLPGFPPALFSTVPLPFLEGRLEDEAADPPEPPRPRLYLDSRNYLRDGALIPILDLPVDSSEYLFNALLYAFLQHYYQTAEAAVRAKLEGRAKALLPDLGAETRLEGYLHAVADFGSHALSVANQLERSARHHRSRGTDLCLHFNRPYSLFGLWDRIFTDLPYEARYYQPPKKEGEVGRWVETGRGIAVEDKRWLVKTAFQSRWQGSRGEDLAPRYCPASP